MKKFLKNFSLLGCLMLVACVLLGIGDVSGAVFANGVATGVAGGTDAAADGLGAVVTHAGKGGALETSDVRNLRPEMIQDPVDQNLVKIRPSLSPLDTILRYGQSMQTDSFEFKWYSIGTRDVDDTLSANATVTSNADPHLVNAVITLTGTVNNFAVSDTIIFPTINGKDNQPLLAYVVKKDPSRNQLEITVAEDQMTVTEVSGVETYGIAAIASGTALYRLGRAAAELDVTTDAISYIPKPTIGYCQRFMFEVAQSTYEKMLKKEIKFDISEIEEQALYEYRKCLEGSFLFGRKGKFWDSVKNTEVYSTGGITRQITNSYTLDDTNSDGTAALIALQKQIFTGNSGAKQRYMFAGSDFVEKMSTIATVQKQIEAGNTEVVWGITWKKIESNFGTLLLVHHELLDEYGWTSRAIVIDPQYLKKWQLSNFERKEYNGKDLAIMNGNFTVCSEVCGVAVYNPDAHAIVKLQSVEPAAS